MNELNDYLHSEHHKRVWEQNIMWIIQRQYPQLEELTVTHVEDNEFKIDFKESDVTADEVGGYVVSFLEKFVLKK